MVRTSTRCIKSPYQQRIVAMTDTPISTKFTPSDTPLIDEPPSDSLTPQEEGPLATCVQWRIGHPPLENDPRVQPYLQQDSKHLEHVRELQHQLTSYKIIRKLQQQTRGR
jgi:hypothetical protein